MMWCRSMGFSGKILLALFLAGFLLVPAPSRAAAAGPQEVISSLYDSLLATMKEGDALGEQGRYNRLDPVIRRSFAIEQMARMAIGPAWDSLSAGEQQQAALAFARYITATYADRFDAYSGEQFRILGDQSSPYGTIVQSQIVKSTGEPVSINYLMLQTGDTWRIADVYLTGTISQMATLRSEFSATLRTQGIAGLIDALNHKADILVASNTRAS